MHTHTHKHTYCIHLHTHICTCICYTHTRLCIVCNIHRYMQYICLCVCVLCVCVTYTLHTTTHIEPRAEPQGNGGIAEYCLFYRALLQKRPMIVSILLTEATAYTHRATSRTTRKWRRCSNKWCERLKPTARKCMPSKQPTRRIWQHATGMGWL